MGVSNVHYIILGIRLEFQNLGHIEPEFLEKFEDNCYVKDVTEKDNITLISDGMNGEYHFIGKVLAKSTSSVGFDEAVSFDCDQNEREKVFQSIQDNFGITLNPTDIQLWVFTHWH